MANEQRISTTKVFYPSVFTINGHEFTNLQYRVLPYFKSSDIIMRFPALKQLGVVIHPSLNYIRESRRIDCMIVDSDKLYQIIVKQARNKKNPSDIFLISLHFAEDVASVKNDFGEHFDQQLKQLITKLTVVTEEPQGLSPHRGHLDHKMKLTDYPPH